MLKTLLCLLLLILIVSGGVSLADTFKCTRPDGSVFFTDDPSQVPRSCVVEKIIEVPSAGTITDTPLQPQTPSMEEPSLPQTKPEVVKSFASFKIEATNLVENFQSARHRVFSSSFVTDQLQARRELNGITKQKEGLLKDIDQSSLSSSEKQELEDILSSIAEF